MWVLCVLDTKPCHGKVPNQDSDAERSRGEGGDQGEACSRVQEGAAWPAVETVWSGKTAQRKDASELGLKGMKSKLS